MKHGLPDIPGYSVLALLGKGGMAEVYLAVQQSLNRKVAIKVLLDNSDPSFNQRFINEGHLVASLHHPAIITIFDIGQLGDGRYYLAMEFIGGGDLAQHGGQVFEPARALNIIRQVAEGLQVVHDKGLIHRDIKPANILFRHPDNVVITDFGIAKNLELDSELTQHGIVVGSPAYSSPEQAQCQPLDNRTDIYSLGVILVELLTGSNPFRGDNYTRTVINHVQGPIPVLHGSLRQYQGLVNRMLAKDPWQRFASCREIIDAIQVLGSTPPITASGSLDDTTVAQPAVTLSRSALSARLANLFGSLSPRLRWSTATVILLVVLLGLNYPMINQQINIQIYLHKAGQRVAANHLTKPADDNASYYYRKVLELDPDNTDALNGMNQLANHFLEKAKAYFDQANHAAGMSNIDKGLAIAPGHSGLLQLREQHSPPAVSREKAAGTRNSKNPFKKLWEKVREL